jgi:acyl-CoA reductase-like NAD-dependent aldehyde dehydrogenase
VKVFCKSTNGNAEFRCSVCGQGFVLFWERQPRTERVAVLHEIQETMRRHHRNSSAAEAHPQGGFLVPDWGDSGELAAASLERRSQVMEL